MSNCKKCDGELSKEGDYVTCSKCEGNYHYQCSLAESTWRKMAAAKRVVWVCSTCKSRAGNTTPPVLGDNESANADKPVTYSELEELLDRKLQSLMGNLDGRFKDIEKSLEFLGGTMEDMANTVKVVQKQVVTLEQKQNKLETQNREHLSRIQQLEVQINQQAQSACDTKLEISGGIPVNVDHEVFIQQVFEKCAISPVPAKSEYVTEKHIFHGKPDQPKSIIVTFQSKAVRDKILTKVRKDKPSLNSKDFTSQEPFNPIYINEHLTPYYKRVLYEAKQIKKDKGYKYLWIRDGKILAKKADSDKVMRINSLQDVGNM